MISLFSLSFHFRYPSLWYVCASFMHRNTKIGTQRLRFQRQTKRNAKKNTKTHFHKQWVDGLQTFANERATSKVKYFKCTYNELVLVEVVRGSGYWYNVYSTYAHCCCLSTLTTTWPRGCRWHSHATAHSSDTSRKRKSWIDRKRWKNKNILPLNFGGSAVDVDDNDDYDDK